MKKITLVLLLLSSFAFVSYAGDDFSAVAEMKKRKLVIALLDENQETVNELKSKGKANEVPSYLENIKKDNEITKAIFTELWKETPLEFIQESKVLSYTPDELSQIAIITHEAATMENVDFMIYDVCLSHKVEGKKGKISYETYNKAFKYSAENDLPSSADLQLLIHKIKVYFDFEKQFDLKTLNDVLAKKTLLLNKETTELTAQEIKDKYEFPFKLVSAEEINNAKNSRDKNYLYVKLDLFRASGQQAFILVDCETGKIMSRSLLGGITKVGFNGPSKQYVSGGQISYSAISAGVNAISYRTCSSCGISGPELVRLYTAKARMKKSILNVLGSQKIQNSSMFSVDLIPY
jgi:hypothetical protein